MAEERQALRFYSLRDEDFPVTRPLSELPHRIFLNEISDHDWEQGSLAAPDTAVLAELEKCHEPHDGDTDLLCSLHGGRYLVIRNELLGLPDDKKRAEMLFPRARIAIKSGMTGASGTGVPVIYVACAAAIEFVGLAEEDQPPSSVLESDRYEYLVSQADRKYQEEQFVLAGLFFSAAAEVASSDEQQALMYYWHALCMHSLDRYEDAIKSYDKVLSRNPCHGNALLKRGKCLSNLGRHSEGLIDMEASLSYPSKEISEHLPILKQHIARVSELAEQQSAGVYDLREFVLSEFDPSKASPCSDFISEDIEFRMTRDGRGRGVFLSREVKAGELLMVSNPMLVADTHELLLTAAVRAYGRSSRFRRLLGLLGDPEEPPESLSLPGIRDFTEIEDDGTSGVIDVRRIKRIVRASLFSAQDSRGRLAIVAAPSFVNHSCLPNTSLVVVRDAFFLRAAKPITAGEEITIAYVDCLRPLVKRAEDLAEFGFKCRCQRCEVERRYQARLRVVPGELKPKTDVEKDAVAMIKKLEIVLGKLPGVTEEEREMIRVGYVEGYLHIAWGKGHRFDICRDACLKLKTLKSDSEAMALMQALVPGEFNCIRLVASVVRRNILELEFDESLGAILDAAVVAMMGDVTLPSEDYLTICDNLAVTMDKLQNLTGRFHRRRFSQVL